MRPWLALVMLLVASPAAATEIRQDADGTKASSITIPSCTGSGKALTHDPGATPPFGCNTITAEGGGVPAGAIVLSLTSCPTGYAEVAALDGKFLRGTVAANADVGQTGGADTITPEGTVASTFTGSALSGGARKGGTSNPASILENGAVPAGTVASTFSGTAFDNRPAYVSVLFCQKS